MIKLNDTPRIYVACLAAYNNGKLHGEWIDCDNGYDAIMDEIHAMLKASPEPFAEEYAIHDFENFYGYKVSEYESIQDIADIAAFLEEYGELGGLVLENNLGDLERSEEDMTDNYLGEFSSLAEYAEDYFNSCYDLSKLPVELQRYIDYEAYARDLDLNGGVLTFEINGNIHVFSNC